MHLSACIFELGGGTRKEVLNENWRKEWTVVDGDRLQFCVGGDFLDAVDLSVGLDQDIRVLERGGWTSQKMLCKWLGNPNGSLKTNYVCSFIIDDSYRSNSCFLYSPHLIAVTTIYLTLVLNPSAQATINRLLSSFSSDKAAESSPHSTEDPGLRYLLLIPD
ncbi:hypothetical protein K435DRAFT_808880 [Dendrothele bispora CBS 962.96]|uniref:Uncharacterized protein n=1 Tax=Dendrothele bispora (strain CBS 962.96) TaxID=1314807 RepID=A0A4S8L012_DENBC|nr:hypothetical protein K435DRAFT_808880 [Dendrothele bispora CBS 962.96]